jgi:hypothetical protein
MVHPIIVVNEAPLSNILNNPAATGRVSLWGIKLSPLDITYEKQKAIKSQVLPDFTAEWLELQNTGPPDLSSVWTMYFDGSKRVPMPTYTTRSLLGRNHRKVNKK